MGVFVEVFCLQHRLNGRNWAIRNFSRNGCGFKFKVLVLRKQNVDWSVLLLEGDKELKAIVPVAFKLKGRPAMMGWQLQGDMEVAACRIDFEPLVLASQMEFSTTGVSYDEAIFVFFRAYWCGAVGILDSVELFGSLNWQILCRNERQITVWVQTKIFRVIFSFKLDSQCIGGPKFFI